MAAPGPWRESNPNPLYRRPAHSPPGQPRPHPYAAVSAPGALRHSYYAPPSTPGPAIPGFYNPALPQLPQPPTPPTAPVFPQPRPGLPPILVPGRAPSASSIPRSSSSDFFFQQLQPAPPFPMPRRQSQTAPAPPLPRKPDFDQPPLPPKPLIIPTPSSELPPGRHLDVPPQASFFEPLDSPIAPPLPPPPPAAESEAEAVVLRRVLELSAQESRDAAPRPTEEEQLARALQESLKFSPGPAPPSRDRQGSAMTASPEQGPLPLPIPDVDRSPGPSSYGGASPLAAGPVPSPRAGLSQSYFPSFSDGPVAARPHVAQQISDDEALARQLAEEEERLLEEERRQKTAAVQAAPSPPPPLPLPSPPSPPALPPAPPEYNEVVAPASFYNSSLASHLLQNGAGPSHTRLPSLGRSVSEKPAPPKASSPLQPNRPLSRSQSLGDRGTASTPSSPSTSLQPATPSQQNERPASTSSSMLESIDESNPGSPTHAANGSGSAGGVEVVSNTQYVDAELLAGLSLGFGTPPITSSLKPFTGVIPNVIALPYGRCPPFHISAPSWRSMLRLMARLSGSRLEPTMEALAIVKTEMKLRVVISFVKVHHSSPIWHTVLYMTIDHPVPATAPTGWKYRNGDSSTLPWSYTLSALPAFLRDGPDSPLSKFYTVPCTSEMPFPALPISFPNLATYLAAALEHARGAMGDGSSGARRLAKYVDQLYPNDRVELEDAQERGGMRRRLKNLVGIGSKPSRGRNEEMYELVTPFVPDEFGR